jgi:hypothetical protein
LTQVDLHTHTTASDGVLTPTQVVQQAAALSLAAIAICDHDTADGVDEALSAGERLGVEVIPCVEISATHEEKIEAHILGYFIDHRNAELRAWLRTLKDARWERGKRMVELLNNAGVGVSFARVAEIAAGGSVGRPHVARAIVEIGRAPSVDSAFGRFLLSGGPGYVPRHKVTPAEAVRTIKKFGGAPCVAHVAKLKRDDLVRDLIKEGLAAIEVFHPDHGPASTRFYFGFAKKHGLVATGGSDAHGICGERGSVGCVTVGYHIVDELREAIG